MNQDHLQPKQIIRMMIKVFPLGLLAVIDDKMFDSDSDGDVDCVAEKYMDGIINHSARNKEWTILRLCWKPKHVWLWWKTIMVNQVNKSLH